ncbi:MAG: apolipoprotein N-acyltransferase [bacterium]|nr:apolipoprotein N-acyltransferase [bacterium]
MKNDIEVKYKIPILILGGIITGISYLFFQFYLAWFCLIPLFYLLEKVSMKHSFIYGVSFGGIAALILYYWIIPVSFRYSGKFTILTIVFYLTAVIYFSIYFGIFSIIYKALHNKLKKTIFLGISTASAFVLIDILKMQLFPGLPWLHYNLAFTQAQNFPTVEWGAVGGLSIINFSIVFFGYLFTQYLITKKIFFLKTAIVVIVLFFTGGFLLTITKSEQNEKKYDVALINENISSETRWNETSGDSIANIFFDLNKQAAEYNPDLIVWSETAIPWKFNTDDQFIPAALNITHKTKADHLMGIWTPSSNEEHMFNSALLILHDGRVVDRYDKNILLDFLEKPLINNSSLTLPFVNSSVFNNILPGKTNHLIKSGDARIGILICNESLSMSSYNDYLKAGTNLIIVMGNNAWFDNTPLIMHHFYVTQMYAKMFGIDVIVNNNRGMIGIIRGMDEAEVLNPSSLPRVINFQTELTTYKTNYSKIYPYDFILYLSIIFLSLFLRRKKK